MQKSPASVFKGVTFRDTPVNNNDSLNPTHAYPTSSSPKPRTFIRKSSYDAGSIADSNRSSYRLLSQRRELKDFMTKNFFRQHPLGCSRQTELGQEMFGKVTSEIGKYVDEYDLGDPTQAPSDIVLNEKFQVFQSKLAQDCNCIRQKHPNEMGSQRSAAYDVTNSYGAQEAYSSKRETSLMLPSLSNSHQKQRSSRNNAKLRNNQTNSMDNIRNSNGLNSMGVLDLNKMTFTKVTQNKPSAYTDDNIRSSQRTSQVNSPYKAQITESTQKLASSRIGKPDKHPKNRLSYRSQSVVENTQQSSRSNKTKSLMPMMRATAKDDQVNDLPSNLSDDEWGELADYKHMLDQEAMLKEKQDYKNKQLKVKQTLEMQIAQTRASNKAIFEQQRRDEIARLDRVAQREKDEYAKQKKKEQNLKADQKKQIDKAISNNKKLQEFQLKKEQEDQKQQVRKLNEAIEKEKQDKLKKLNEERSAARKVISENETHRIKRQEDLVNQKQKDFELLQQEMNARVKLEQRRAEQETQRLAKIEAIMSRMGDQFDPAKEKALLLKQDQDFINRVIDNDRQAQKQMEYEKAQKKYKSQQVNHILDQQIAAKRSTQKLDFENSKRFIEQAQIQDQEAQKKIKLEQSKLKELKVQNKEELKQQMVSNISKQNTHSGVEQVRGFQQHLMVKHKIGGQMNAQEARMNRELLWKMAERKKQSSSSALMPTQVESPVYGEVKSGVHA